jgi:predicted deacylase
MLRRAFLELAATGLLLGRAAPAAPATRALAAGTRFETPCHELRGSGDGPMVMVVAGIHGNEPAPPLAARALLSLELARGTLVIVPEVNRLALSQKTRHTPGVRHADLNRNFPTRMRSETREPLAAALWAETLAVSPSWVLDLHEGWGFRRSSASMGSSIVYVNDARTVAMTLPLARDLVARIDATIADPRRRFSLIERGPEGSYARAVTERLGTPSYVFETTWTEPIELRVSQQLLLVRSFLESLAMIRSGPQRPR